MHLTPGRRFLALHSLLDPSPPAVPPAARDGGCDFGTYPALAALVALNAIDWTAPPLAMARITLVCAPPSSHVDAELLRSALGGASTPLLRAALISVCADANAKHTGVTFACLGPPSDSGGREAELRASHAASALSAALGDSENGSLQSVPLCAPAVSAFALTLLFPDAGGAGSISGAGRPIVEARLQLPAPLLAGGARRLRLALRPTILPLHDDCAPVKLCRCHGRALLSRDSTIGADDISHMLSLAQKNDVCPVSAKGLTPPEWLPNAIAIGRDTSLLLPSFYTPSFLAQAAPPATLSVLATVPLASLSESWLFGTPWAARALDESDPGLSNAEEEEEEEEFDCGANATLFAAVCASLAQSDAGLLLASASNLDSGRSTPFKCLYIAFPPAGGGGGPASMLLKRVAAKEELLPSPPAAAGAAMAEVPPDVQAEVSRSLAALPTRAPYDPLACERGVFKVLSGLVNKSLAPPLPSRGAKAKRKG